jgi:hypothetical protein
MKTTRNPTRIPPIPWKTDFVPQQARLLPPTMINIVINIPSNLKKLFLARHTRVKYLAFGTINNHDEESTTNSMTPASAVTPVTSQPAPQLTS